MLCGKGHLQPRDRSGERVGTIVDALQLRRQRLQRRGIEAVAKDLAAANYAALDVEMDLHTAPGETGIKQVREVG